METRAKIGILFIIHTINITLRKYEASGSWMIDTSKRFWRFRKIRVVIVKIDPVDDLVADVTSMILSRRHDTLIDL